MNALAALFLGDLYYAVSVKICRRVSEVYGVR
jgi:hypothetical protein